ncbi:MAG: hypothetical protein ACI4WH_02335 [Oscillospiraceae bacterium]
MKEEKSIRRGKSLKGTVLFTVVAVMMVMIVFVMATLTIAGAANKRAYSSYSKNQTTYTAKSVLDATLQAMCHDTSIANSVANASTTGTTLSVTLPDESMGTAVVTAKKVGTTQQLNTKTGGYESKDVVLLSATATLGDETSTVTNYFVLNPVEQPDVPSGINKALTVLGDIDNGDGINAFGGASVGIGINETRWDNKPARTYKVFTNNNPRPATGNFAINGSYRNSSSSSDTMYLSNRQSFNVFGDLFDNDGSPFSIQSVVDVTTASSYDELPYIFVERSFDINKNCTIGDATHPIVVYCGGNFLATTDLSRAASLYSDVYVYNYDFGAINNDYTGDDTFDAYHFNSDMFTITVSNTNMSSQKNDNSPSQYGVSRIGSNNNGAGLLEWASSIVNGSAGVSTGGNFYTEGSLILNKATIGGDCYVGDDLEVNGNPEIKGVLTVENDCYIKPSVNMQVDYFDVDPAKLYVQGNPSINGVQYNSVSGANALEKNTNFKDEINGANSTYVYTYVGTGGDYTVDKEWDGTPKYQKVAMGKGDYKEDYVYDDINGTWVECTNPYYAPDTDVKWWEVGKKYNPWDSFGGKYDSYDHYRKDKVYVGAGLGDYKLKYKSVAPGTGDYTRTEVPGSDPLLTTEFPSNRTLKDVIDFVDTPQDILEEYTEDDGSGTGTLKYKNSDYPTTNPNHTSTVYTSYSSAILNGAYGVSADVLRNGALQTPNSEGYYEISEDCTLEGSFEKTNMLFKPGTGTLWIELGASFTDGNGFNFVVDDSQGGTVNFFIPDNTSVNICNNSKIWTKKYMDVYNTLKSGGSYTVDFYQTTINTTTGDEEVVLDGMGNPVIDHTETYNNLTLFGSIPKFSSMTEFIPHINVYSGENNASLKFTNNSFLTGYILAPYLKGEVSTGGLQMNIDYADNQTMTKVPFSNAMTQVIGAVVVGSDFKTANASTFVFVAKDTSKSSSSTPPLANGDTIQMYSSTYQNS